MNARHPAKRGFTLVELMIVVAIIGLLAAIAIPNFIKFQAKSKQSEAKTNLKAIFAAESVHFAERDTYANFSATGFTVERGNRYAYTIDPALIETQVRTTAQLPIPTTPTGFDQIQVDCYRLVGGACTAALPGAPTPGGNTAYVQPTILTRPGITSPAATPGLVSGSAGSAIAQAVGNVDNDNGKDAWDIGINVSLTVTNDICGAGGSAPSGQPVNSWNDSVCD